MAASRSAAACAAICGAVLFCGPAVAGDADVTPYRVAVAVTATPELGETVAFDAIRSRVGDGLRRAFAPAIEITADVAAENYDKRFDVALSAVAGKFRIAVTEYDATFAVTSAPVTVTAPSARGNHGRVITDAAVAAAAAAFRPVASIRPGGERGRVTLVPRAARLVPTDRRAVRLDGRFLTAFLVSPGRHPEAAADVRRVPSTYLAVESARGGEGFADGPVGASVISPFRNPFARSRGRSRFAALAVGPVHAETELSVVMSGTPSVFGPTDSPAAGRAVLVTPLVRDGEEQTRFLPRPAEARDVILDRDGRMTFPAGRPVLLEIRAAGRTVASRPLLPGAVATVVWRLPDDRYERDFRLVVEEIESSLIETVAARSVFVRRGNVALDRGDIDDAERWAEKAAGLPGAGVFLRRLDASAAANAAAAGEAGNARATARIERERRRVTGTIKRFLAGTAIDTLRERIETNRDLAGLVPE